MNPDCKTCLYMATHEHCSDCLKGPMEAWTYPRYKEGNWMARITLWELEGKRSIVIGGQGEAEVNAKTDPHETAKNLHYVAECCGYMTGNLIHKDDLYTQKISTSEGTFTLVWDDTGLVCIEANRVEYDPEADCYVTTRVGDYWNRDKCLELVAAAAAR